MRLIDADALIDSLKKDWQQTSKITWAQIVAKCAPTIIDAEPVVRCKDCKYWNNRHSGGVTYCHRLGICMTKADDYCSYGEKKTDTD